MNLELAIEIKELPRGIQASSVLSHPSMDEAYQAVRTCGAVHVELVCSLGFKPIAEHTPTRNDHSDYSVLHYQVDVEVVTRTIEIVQVHQFIVGPEGQYSFQGHYYEEREANYDSAGHRSTLYKISVNQKTGARYEILTQP